MITIWKTPIVATVEQVLKDLKLQLYGAGLLKEIKNTGSDLMCTCPFHANGKEHNPSCGVLLQQKVTKDKTYEAGTVHCYTCGYTADEPFVGLDPKAALDLKNIMKELCRQGSAIFFSTHVLEVAQKLCNKIAIIKDGKLVTSGNMEEVVKNQSLEDLFMEVTTDDK